MLQAVTLFDVVVAISNKNHVQFCDLRRPRQLVPENGFVFQNGDAGLRVAKPNQLSHLRVEQMPAAWIVSIYHLFQHPFPE